MPLIDYLLSRAVPQPNGCIEWTGQRDADGYARFSYRRAKANGVSKVASRAVYQLSVGAIGPGLQVDHLCRNRACINVDHLEAVTPRENSLRSPVQPAAVNARKTHCIHGHEFDKANTYRPPGTTHRVCRACGRETQRRANLRKKAKR